MIQKKSKNDTSNTIEEISTNYKKKGALQQENVELRALASAQDITIQKLHDSLSDKDKQIDHLKTLLAGAVPLIGKVERINQSSEELIAEIQLKKLGNKAEFNELTLEEARKFEIFAKIKNNTKSSSIPAQYTVLKEDATRLLEIANSAVIKTDKDE